MAKLEQGLIQIYTGNGKGKSTAAFGLALRAAGQDLQVAIIQFMKAGGAYGELASFAKLKDHVQVFTYGSGNWVKVGEGSQADLEQAQKALQKCYAVFKDAKTDLVIVDEICNALYFQLITIDEVLSLLAAKPPQVELVLTGRNAPAELIAAADLVTEMCEIKHPFKAGINSRQGIEY